MLPGILATTCKVLVSKKVGVGGERVRWAPGRVRWRERRKGRADDEKARENRNVRRGKRGSQRAETEKA